MPELPEVETIKNDLCPLVVGKIITKVTFPPDPKTRILRRFPSQEVFVRAVTETRVQNLRRRAKYLIFDLYPTRTLVMHLGMSGQLLLRETGSPPEPYLRAVFYLGHDRELRFVDPRKFGELFLKLPLAKDCQLNLDRLGPEPLEREFSLTYLAGCLKKSRRTIKTFLMDQKVIAGLGNIYSDECLFRANIHPRRLTYTLGNEEIRRLHQAIKKILKEAIRRRGTTASDQRYRDGLGRMGNFQEILRVYQRRGNPCHHCGATVESTQIGGRTASYCPLCQK